MRILLSSLSVNVGYLEHVKKWCVVSLASLQAGHSVEVLVINFSPNSGNLLVISFSIHRWRQMISFKQQKPNFPIQQRKMKFWYLVTGHKHVYLYFLNLSSFIIIELWRYVQVHSGLLFIEYVKWNKYII